MAESLHLDTIQKALRLLGSRLGVERSFEIVIAGGGAGVLIGALPGNWVTADLDAIQFLPNDANDEILRAAGEIRQELSLPPDWLNEHSRLYFHALPDDWQLRRKHVGQFGSLSVFAIGRLDLIAMKFLAHRQEDLEHLSLLTPAIGAEDLAFVRRYLDTLEAKQFDRGRIDMARAYLTEWKAAT